MNLWDALGITPQSGLLAAIAGLLVAVVLAAGTAVRRSRSDTKRGLGLDDHL